uniref:Uncharacterized protein n=1 Tax=Romanomermis culicivorax TaxID=13658 RepID=A0A915JI00_ROMCU
VYFEAKVEHVKFVDFCGKYRLPLLQYLCSPKCSTAPAFAYTSSSSSDGGSGSLFHKNLATNGCCPQAETNLSLAYYFQNPIGSKHLPSISHFHNSPQLSPVQNILKPSTRPSTSRLNSPPAPGIMNKLRIEHGCPFNVKRSVVGFNEQMPLQWAGVRTLPPMSDPTPKGEPCKAIKAASPLVEPPGLLSGSKGLRVAPYMGLQLPILMPVVGTLVRRNGTAPADLNFWTRLQSWAADVAWEEKIGMG